MTTVFISYRRQDTDAFADAIAEDLQRRLGKARVFLDVNGIAPGDDFEDVLMQRVRASTVVLVLVGANWLDVRDSQDQRRLDNPKDWVRTEVREALQLKKWIIPVLVRGGRMPERDALPQDIQAFASCNAFTLTEMWRDVPLLGSVVEGRLSVAEPMVLMGLAAAYAHAGRGTQRDTARPYQGGDTELDQIALLASHYNGGLGVSLYYTVLVLGALIALRARLGWRMEEMLRIALCTTAGVTLGYMLSAALRSWLDRGSPWVSPTLLALWFGGLAAGTLLGIRHFAPVRPTPLRAIVALSLGIAAAAFAGGLLQSAVTSWLAPLIQSPYSNLRTTFWGPVLVAASVLWWRLERKRLGLSGSELMAVLVPLLLSLLLVDTVAIATSFVLYAGNIQELRTVIADHDRHINVLFFATLAGVATWRINRVLRRRGVAAKP